MFIKKEIFINMDFIYVTFWKWMQTVGQFCLLPFFFPHLSQIVVNVFENDKTNIPCALTPLICVSLCVP